MGLYDIEQELLDVFKTIFHYDTDAFLIPAKSTRDAALATRDRLQDFVNKYDGPASLLIVIYQGHSDIHLQPGQPLQLYGSMNHGGVTLPWGLIDTQLIVDGDVLAIMDSCFTTASAMGPGEIEYLVSSAFESPATTNFSTSFSRRLIDLLTRLQPREITVAQIHAKLVNKANDPKSSLEYTPVHVAFIKKPSITLRPLYRAPKELSSLKKADQLSDGKVLVSVLLQGKTSIPDVEKWKDWLSKDIPENIADVKLEAVFDSSSSLCLLTLPTAVWNMLKANESFKFVAFVKGNDYMNARTENSGAPHVWAPQSGIFGSRPGNIQLSQQEKD